MRRDFTDIPRSIVRDVNTHAHAKPWAWHTSSGYDQNRLMNQKKTSMTATATATYLP